MKRSIGDTADRFDEMSGSYDEVRSLAHVFTALRTLEIALCGIQGDELVVDIGTGTGSLALNLSHHVEKVVALDISDGMLQRAERKAKERDLKNIDFGHGRFRDLDMDFSLNDVDLIVSNFAMHHLSDSEKVDAIDEMKSVLASDGRIVIGDIIIADIDDESEEYYHPDVDDPSRVDFLLAKFRERGFSASFTRTGKMTGVIEAVL